MFSKETHILAVDDSLNIRRMVASSLQRLGYNKITTAEDAVEAMGNLNFSLKPRTRSASCSPTSTCPVPRAWIFSSKSGLIPNLLPYPLF